MESLFPVDPILLGIALVVTTFASALQSTVGIGFAIVSVPVLSMLDPRLAPVPQLLIILPLTLSMALRERGAIDAKGVVRVMCGRVLGTLCGIGLLAAASQRVLDVIIAAIVLSAVIALIRVERVPRNAVTEVIAGTLSGASALISSIGGPPLALLYSDSKGETLRASLGVIFSLGLILTIGGRAYLGHITKTETLIAAWLFPGVLIGFALSNRWLHRINGKILRRAIFAIASFAAVGLLIRGLWGT